MSSIHVVMWERKDGSDTYPCACVLSDDAVEKVMIDFLRKELYMTRRHRFVMERVDAWRAENPQPRPVHGDGAYYDWQRRYNDVLQAADAAYPHSPMDISDDEAWNAQETDELWFTLWTDVAPLSR